MVRIDGLCKGTAGPYGACDLVYEISLSYRVLLRLQPGLLFFFFIGSFYIMVGPGVGKVLVGPGFGKVLAERYFS